MDRFSFQQLTFTIQIFREGKMFVAYNPELGVSSCGDNAADARVNLHDAVRGFIKSADKHGTLAAILEDAGYIHKNRAWQDPELIAMDRFSVAA